ncbi:MAG: type II toxin-antitoxin system RelE/ParE family toxin [Spiroplasmataceae bacterium]|jgi:proteic killer suppression protein|nr:type II toxin-antitoxin system RelE/ParE family toxin [Spiroplasmataceae bacterium]
MIKSFADKNTEMIWNRKFVKKFSPQLAEIARECLVMLHNAHHWNDLRFPPSNNLHKLEGDRKGQSSISINKQFRICFIWGKDNHAYEVEIVDYH